MLPVIQDAAYFVRRRLVSAFVDLNHNTHDHGRQMTHRIISELPTTTRKVWGRGEKLLPPTAVQTTDELTETFLRMGPSEQTSSYLMTLFSRGANNFLGISASLAIYSSLDGENEELYAAVPVLRDENFHGTHTPDEFPPVFLPDPPGYLRVGLHFLIPKDDKIEDKEKTKDRILNVRYNPPPPRKATTTKASTITRGRWVITCVAGFYVKDLYTGEPAPTAAKPNMFIVEEQVNNLAYVQVKAVAGVFAPRSPIKDMSDLVGRFRAWCKKWGGWLRKNMNLMPPVTINTLAISEYVRAKFPPEAHKQAFKFYRALYTDGMSYLSAALIFLKIAEMVEILNRVHARKQVVLCHSDGDSGLIGWDTPKSQNLCTMLAVYAGLRFDAIDLNLCRGSFSEAYYAALYTQPNTVFLLFDDVMYSGSQMEYAVNLLRGKGVSNLELCVPFCLPKSLGLMRSFTHPEVAAFVMKNNELWIHSALSEPNVRDCLEALCAKLDSERAAQIIEATKDLYLVIPQFRIPDMHKLKKLSGPPLHRVLVCEGAGHCLDRPYLSWVRTAMVTEFGTRAGCPLESRYAAEPVLPPFDDVVEAAPKEHGLEILHLSSEVPEREAELTRWSVAPGLFISGLLQDAGRRQFGPDTPFVVVALVVVMALVTGKERTVVLKWCPGLKSLVYPDAEFEGATSVRAHAHWLACFKRPRDVAIDYSPFEHSWTLRFVDGRVQVFPEAASSKRVTVGKL